MVRHQAALASGTLTRVTSGVNLPPSEVIMSSLFKNSPPPLTCYNAVQLIFVKEGVRAMSDRGAQILKDALALPPTERVALVERLLASLDSPAREHLDMLWSQEAEDRLDAFERGEIPTMPAQDVFDEIGKRKKG
jgi:putative addiction module component (TIGR02574 family)